MQDIYQLSRGLKHDERDECGRSEAKFCGRGEAREQTKWRGRSDTKLQLSLT